MNKFLVVCAAVSMKILLRCFSAVLVLSLFVPLAKANTCAFISKVDELTGRFCCKNGNVIDRICTVDTLEECSFQGSTGTIRHCILAEPSPEHHLKDLTPQSRSCDTPICGSVTHLDFGMSIDYAKELMQLSDEKNYDIRVFHRLSAGGKPEVLVLLGEAHMMPQRIVAKARSLLDKSALIGIEGGGLKDRKKELEITLSLAGMVTETPFNMFIYFPAVWISKMHWTSKMFPPKNTSKQDSHEAMVQEAMKEFAAECIKSPDYAKNMTCSPRLLAKNLAKTDNRKVVNLDEGRSTTNFDLLDNCINTMSKFSSSICAVSFYTSLWNSEFSPSYFTIGAASVYLLQNFGRPYLSKLLQCIPVLKNNRAVKRIDSNNLLLIDRNESMLLSVLRQLKTFSEPNKNEMLVILGKAHLSDIADLIKQNDFKEIDMEEVAMKLASAETASSGYK